MGAIFGQQLRDWRQARQISGKWLAERSGIGQGNLGGIERGDRPPSDANLEALAGVPELELPLVRLRAWRAADRIGREDLWLILTEGQALVQGIVEDFGEPGATYSWSRGAAPAAATAAHPDAAITGPGAKPLSATERRLYAQIVAAVGGEPREAQVEPGRSLWLEPPARRKALLTEIVRELVAAGLVPESVMSSGSGTAS